MLNRIQRFLLRFVSRKTLGLILEGEYSELETFSYWADRCYEKRSTNLDSLNPFEIEIIEWQKAFKDELFEIKNTHYKLTNDTWDPSKFELRQTILIARIVREAAESRFKPYGGRLAV